MILAAIFISLRSQELLSKSGGDITFDSLGTIDYSTSVGYSRKQSGLCQFQIIGRLVGAIKNSLGITGIVGMKQI